MSMKLKRDYRVAEGSFAKVKPEDRPWAIIEQIWNAYADCPDSQMATFLRRLTPGQRAFVALNGLVAEVNNGGIHQYFWNSTGNLSEQVLAGLKLVGAQAHLRLFRKALKLFPDPAVLKSRSRRQKTLDRIATAKTARLFDEPFSELEGRRRSQLLTLQLAYLKKHPDEFILPAGQAEEQIPLPRPGERDYRVSPTRHRGLRGEKLHWALIKKLWDDYWEPLKAGKQEFLDFLPTISKGQRALIAIDILNKTVLKLGGFKHFLGTQAGADVLASEVKAGFQLLVAEPYSALFNHVLQVAGDLTDLNRRVADQSRRLDRAKKSMDETAMQAARQEWHAAFRMRRKREDELADALEAFTSEYRALLESTDRKIEPYIEAYVDAHPEEFFR